MRLHLYTAPLRTRHRVESIQDVAEVPDALAETYLAMGVARPAAPPRSGRVERAVAPKPEVAVEEPKPEWPHKMAPAQYLARFPDGPDADMARSIVGSE